MELIRRPSFLEFNSSDHLKEELDEVRKEFKRVLKENTSLKEENSKLKDQLSRKSRFVFVSSNGSTHNPPWGK